MPNADADANANANANVNASASPGVHANATAKLQMRKAKCEIHLALGVAASCQPKAKVRGSTVVYYALRPSALGDFPLAPVRFTVVIPCLFCGRMRCAIDRR